MKKAILLFGILLFVTAQMIGCAARKPETTTTPATDDIIDNVPGWYNNPPEDDEQFYGPGTGTSRDLQVARNKASQAAMAEVAKEIEAAFDAMRDQLLEEIGTADKSHFREQWTESSRLVVSQLLRGLHMEESGIQNEGGVYRAYVLYSMPVGASYGELERRLSENEEITTIIRKTEAFKQMKQAIDEYKQSKSKQGP